MALLVKNVFKCNLLSFFWLITPCYGEVNYCCSLCLQNKVTLQASWFMSLPWDFGLIHVWPLDLDQWEMAFRNKTHVRFSRVGCV